MLAVVLLELEPREEARVCDELQRLEPVSKAHLTDGEFDALLLVEGQGPAEIGRFVFEKIRTIRGVNRTVVEMTQPFKTSGGRK